MLRVSGVSKRYGNVQALDQISATFLPGEIHAVLGENGAGKSTLMGVMAGFVVPDTGSMAIDREPVPLGRPYEAKRHGIAMVHQHFTLVPAFTVGENLALAHVEKLDVGHSPEDANASLELAERLGWQLDARALARDLPVGVQQRVEILKALSGRAEYLIFDEPTAVLAPDEVLDLFRVLRELRDANKAIILIAHKLSEVMAIADTVTVLRRGRVVGHAPIAEVDEARLAEWMVGESFSGSHRNHVAPSLEGTRTALQVENLRVRGDRGEEVVRDVSFQAESGEIFGIGGVDGNGQVELAEALAGVRRAESGSLNWTSDSLQSSSETVAYIPQDRQMDGLALELSIVDNLMIAGHRAPHLSRGPFVRQSAAIRWASDLIERFDIKVDRISDPASSLSGGNQQKVVVARNLDQTPRLLIAVNPTRGLDIKATQFVREQLRLAARAGAVVVLFSTDLDELLELADRRLFMSRGQLSAADSAQAYLGGGP